MKFTKVEGSGNHFILLDLITYPDSELKLNTTKISALCNPYFGIGADGILLVKKQLTSDDLSKINSNISSHFEMIVFNADGSLAEMCGNGLRCVVHYLNIHHQFLTMQEPVKHILTGAGLLEVRILPNDGHKETLIGVNMGWPDLKEPVEIADNSFSKYSFGNPHIVTYKPEHFIHREVLGPQWAKQVIGGINISFAHKLDESNIKLHVHERGCGWTQACGTGACASVFQGYQDGSFKIGQTIHVHLPGGKLDIELTKKGLIMWGPAREVFSGYSLLD